jgi:hypothetical protein
LVQALVGKAERSRTGFAVIVDGLDEAGADHVSEVAAALAELQMANVVLVVASRREFFDRQYDTLQPNLTNLVEILELCAWNEGDVLEFVGKYSDRVGSPQLSSAVQRILNEVRGADEMLSNPMRLTLLLYLLVTGAAVDPRDLREPYSLYRAFYSEWIKKERNRGTGGFTPAIIREGHTTLARWMYEHKGEPCHFIDVMRQNASGSESLLSDSAFIELLIVGPNDPSDLVIVEFRHETIGEFLIAQDIIETFMHGGISIDDALGYTVADDVNSFVRSAMIEMSRPMVDKCLGNLAARYDALLPGTATAAELDGNLRVREQLLYYIGRLPLEGCPPILKRGFRQETQPLLRRAAALGAILLGDSKIEGEYLALLDTPGEEILNRSVQMVYFGDVHADLHTFVESGEDWSKTRTAIFKRLTGTSLRDIRLRLWDLRTLRSFYESRNYSPALSSEEVRVLSSVSVKDPVSQNRSSVLRREHALLMTRIQAAQ